MSVFGYVLAGIGLIPKIVSLFKKDKKPSTLDVFSHIFSNIMPQLNLALAYGELDDKAKVDAWLEQLDKGTGSDDGALDVVKDLPNDQEEKLFDHFKEALRIYLYGRIKVPGYTTANA